MALLTKSDGVEQTWPSGSSIDWP